MSRHDLDRLESGETDEGRAAPVEPVAVDVDAIRADAALVARYAKGSNTAEHRLSTVHVPALLAAVEWLTRQADGYCDQAHQTQAAYERACDERERLRMQLHAAEDRERALRAAVEDARGHVRAYDRAPTGSQEETQAIACVRATLDAALSPLAPAETAPTGSEAPVLETPEAMSGGPMLRCVPEPIPFLRKEPSR